MLDRLVTLLHGSAAETTKTSMIDYLAENLSSLTVRLYSSCSSPVNAKNVTVYVQQKSRCSLDIRK